MITASLVRGYPSTDPDTGAEFARIVDDLTRRNFLAGAAATAAVLGLSACGDSGSPPAETTTRTVQSAYGPVKVPARPKRVVCLTTFPALDMADLGMTPAAGLAVSSDFDLPVYVADLQDVPELTSGADGPDLEQIVTFSPDLILGVKDVVLDHRRVAQIAPAVLLDPQVPHAWKVLAAGYASALGKSAALAALEREYTGHAARVGRQHSSILARAHWAIILSGKDTFGLDLATSSAGTILHLAGGQMIKPAAGANSTSGNQVQNYSLEHLGILADADVILDYGSLDGTPYTDLSMNPLWNGLKAVRSGHYYPTPLVSPRSYGEANALLDLVATICGDLANGAQ